MKLKLKNNLFTDTIFYKKLLTYMLPIALQSLMLSAVATADAIMLGRIQQDQMAAVSLATQVQFIQNMILTSITGTASILGAQYWGKKDKTSLEHIFALAFKLAISTSLIFFVLCVIFPRQLMLIFTNDNTLIAIGANYLKIAGLSYLLTGFSQCYLVMFKVTEQPNKAAFISSSAVILNILLNGIFIFGLLGAPKMNASGAALSTLVARIIELSLCVVTALGKNCFSIRLKSFFSKASSTNIKQLHRDYYKCALPLLGGALFWGVGFTAYTAILGHLGSDIAAANSVAAVVRDLLCCLSTGISSAGGIIVGNELGAGNLKKGKLYGDRLALLSIVCGLITMIIVLIIAPFVLNFMVLTETAKEYLSGIFIILSFYMVARCITSVVINGIFAAGGDTMFDMYSLAVSMWCVALPLSFLGAFVFHWPVLVVYALTCIDEIGKIPWVMIHYKRYKWVKNLTN